MEMKSEFDLSSGVFKRPFFRRDIRSENKKKKKNNLLSKLCTSIYNAIINITYVESDESTFLEASAHCFFKSSCSAY